jgi:6-methylsalicylate decarboxylase
MDSQHIATGMLCLSTPSVVGWNGSARRDMARRVNEFTAELHRREAVVLVHPGSAPGQPPFQSADGVASPLVDFPFETTRTAVQLVLNGVVERYPAARISLAHAGGFVPYAALRFAVLTPHFRPDVGDPEKTLALLQHFYFDTALASGPAMPTLKSFAGTSRILFGSDFPYAPANIAAAFTSSLDASRALTPDELDTINHRNAWSLFPRLAPLHAESRS